MPAVAPDRRDALERIAAALAGMPEGLRKIKLKALDEDDLLIVSEALSLNQVEGWRSTPDAMAAHLLGRRFERYKYIRLLGDQYRKLVTGEEPRQIWNIPARYGKSTVGSRWGPAWLLDQAPQTTSMLISYGDDLANENAIAVRDILIQYGDELRARLRLDRRRMDRFVTDEGGGILAAGINSSITGFGVSEGGLLIIDDPFKNWTEAHQKLTRDKVWNNYRSVLRIRLDSDDCGILVIQTRWHEDDLTGKLLTESQEETGDEFKLVRLPALAERADPESTNIAMRFPDPLGRAVGDPLCPERFPLEAVKARARALGTYLTAGLEQQRPAPEEGGEIKRAWFKIEQTVPLAADEWISSWDMKLKDTKGGSYVVGGVWARTGTGKWLLDVYRGQWSQATTINAIALCSVRWPQIATHLIENTGNGPEVMAGLREAHKGYTLSPDMIGDLGMTVGEAEQVQTLRRRGIGGLIPITPRGSKVVRMRGVSGSIEAGDVHLPERAPWLGAYLDEIASFPNEPNDQADMTSQALVRLIRGPATIAAARPMPNAPTRIPRARRRFAG